MKTLFCQLYWDITDTFCVCLRCTTWWFNICIYYEATTIVSLFNIHQIWLNTLTASQKRTTTTKSSKLDPLSLKSEDINEEGKKTPEDWKGLNKTGNIWACAMKERATIYQLICFLVYSQKKYLGTYQLSNIA